MKQYLIKSSYLAFAMLSIPIMAQQKTVTGTVTDEKGLPLIGVNVVVSGTQRGTSTDFDGKFSIEASRGETLKFTYIGYKSKVVKVTTATALNISLIPTAEQLSEVVVVGYGEQNKAELSSAISQVDVKKTLQQTNFTNVSEALSGSVAGISVSAGSGQPGSSTFDIIRGVGSISAYSRPLYIINGVPVINNDPTSLPNSNPLAALDPNAVQSVTILKDASATAIYGARGANGVILITTKSGAYNERRQISFHSEYSLGDIAFDKFKPLNAQQWITRYATGLLNAGEAANLDAARAMAIASQKKGGWDGKRSTDWKRYTTRDKAMVLSNHINISGGAEKIKYNLGLSAYSNKGLQLGTDFNRYALNLSLTHRYSDQLRFGTHINLAHADQNSILEDASYSNPIMARYFVSPTVLPYNKDGSYNRNLGAIGSANPIAVSKLNVNNAKQLFLNGNIFATYRFLDMLQFRSTLSTNYIRYAQNIFYNPFYGDGANYNGYGAAIYNTGFTWDWSNVLNFRRQFGIHAFDMDLGTSITAQRNGYIQSEGKDFAFSDLFHLINAAKKVGASSNLTPAHFRSYFTRLTYTLHDKYSVTGTYRRDGSSRFGPNKKFGDFWAISGAWDLNRENFMGDFFDDLKLRASYGSVGNAEIGEFAYLSLISPLAADGSNNRYNQKPGLAIANVGNGDLSWESKQELDLGLDLAVFSERLRFVFDYYRARSYDLLLYTPLSPTTGFSQRLQNLGELVNRGFEFSLSGNPIRKRDFSWNAKAVLSINHNEVTDLHNLSLSGTTLHDFKQPAVGQPLGAWYMRGWAGVDPKTGGPLWFTDATEAKTTADYSQAEPYYHGNSIPRYVGGLTNTLQYKNLSLSFLLDYKGGYKVYDNWARYYDSDGRYISAMGCRKGAFTDRWTKENPNAQYPKYVYGGGGDIVHSNDYSSRYLYDGGFIRLRRVELGYTLPKKLVASLKLTDLTLYVKATNLWTHAFDKDLYFEPEVLNNDPQRTGYKTTPQWRGAGYYNVAQPVMRYCGMGVHITF